MGANQSVASHGHAPYELEPPSFKTPSAGTADEDEPRSAASTAAVTSSHARPHAGMPGAMSPPESNSEAAPTAAPRSEPAPGSATAGDGPHAEEAAQPGLLGSAGVADAMREGDGCFAQLSADGARVVLHSQLSRLTVASDTALRKVCSHHGLRARRKDSRMVLLSQLTAHMCTQNCLTSVADASAAGIVAEPLDNASVRAMLASLDQASKKRARRSATNVSEAESDRVSAPFRLSQAYVAVSPEYKATVCARLANVEYGVVTARAAASCHDGMPSAARWLLLSFAPRSQPMCVRGTA